MHARSMPGTWARWILGGVILASSPLAPAPAHAATTHPAGAAIRPAPVGKVAAPKLKEHALAMRPVLRRATNSAPGARTSLIIRSRPGPTTPVLAAYSASRIPGTLGARPNGMTHIGIDGSAVRPRK
jgi:hypothetical protein